LSSFNLTIEKHNKISTETEKTKIKTIVAKAFCSTTEGDSSSAKKSFEAWNQYKQFVNSNKSNVKDWKDAEIREKYVSSGELILSSDELNLLEFREMLLAGMISMYYLYGAIYGKLGGN
jgi:hypothetical protein